MNRKVEEELFNCTMKYVEFMGLVARMRTAQRKVRNYSAFERERERLQWEADRDIKVNLEEEVDDWIERNL